MSFRVTNTPRYHRSLTTGYEAEIYPGSFSSNLVAHHVDPRRIAMIDAAQEGLVTAARARSLPVPPVMYSGRAGANPRARVDPEACRQAQLRLFGQHPAQQPPSPTPYHSIPYSVPPNTPTPSNPVPSDRPASILPPSNQHLVNPLPSNQLAVDVLPSNLATADPLTSEGPAPNSPCTHCPPTTPTATTPAAPISPERSPRQSSTDASEIDRRTPRAATTRLPQGTDQENLPSREIFMTLFGTSRAREQPRRRRHVPETPRAPPRAPRIGTLDEPHFPGTPKPDPKTELAERIFNVRIRRPRNIGARLHRGARARRARQCKREEEDCCVFSPRAAAFARAIDPRLWPRQELAVFDKTTPRGLVPLPTKVIDYSRVLDPTDWLQPGQIASTDPKPFFSIQPNAVKATLQSETSQDADADYSSGTGLTKEARLEVLAMYAQEDSEARCAECGRTRCLLAGRPGLSKFPQRV